MGSGVLAVTAQQRTGNWMAQRKAHEVDAWLARPAGETTLVLCYGPDRGLVAERASRFATSTGLPLDDPFVVVKLDAAALEKEPGRLLDETQAIAMFAPRRLIWVRGAGADKRLADDVKAVLAAPGTDALVLIEAGDLKKGTALRANVEAAPLGMALPCYADDGRDLDRVIDEELGKAGLSIGLDARRLLRDSLGGDRMATRGELRKLALYMHGHRQIEVEDVRLAISDVSDASIDDVIDAVLSGDVRGVDEALGRALTGTQQIFPILAALQRQLHGLHVLRGAVDNGSGVAAAVAALRPPVLFSRRAIVEKAASSWSSGQVERALARMQGLVLATRKRPDLAIPAVRQNLFGLAAEVAAKRARR